MKWSKHERGHDHDFMLHEARRVEAFSVPPS